METRSRAPSEYEKDKGPRECNPGNLLLTKSQISSSRSFGTSGRRGACLNVPLELIHMNSTRSITVNFSTTWEKSFQSTSRNASMRENPGGWEIRQEIRIVRRVLEQGDANREAKKLTSDFQICKGLNLSSSALSPM